MGGQSSTNVSKSSNIATTTRASSNIIQPRARIVQNFLLIWVDANINPSSKDCQNTLAQLRSVVNYINTFTEPEQCIQFLNDVKNEKAFVIVSGALGQKLVSKIHGMQQLDAVYIFCGNKSVHEQWAGKWDKIKGVHTEITPICEALQMAAKQCNEDLVAVSFASVSSGISRGNLNQLDPSFMYTQIFKEILLEIEYNEKSIKDLAIYCRGHYQNNMAEITNINEFERKYNPESSIWWYTRECFTYQMLNRALRMLEGDTIIYMGFFIRDLHCQIEELYREQIDNYRGKSFLVYRGQGLSKKDFATLQKTTGGLMSFNSFLSTSKKPAVALDFAKKALTRTGMVGIYFQIFIDPSVSSTTFAAIKDISFHRKEEEILFSMHSVFRIGEIKQMDKNTSLYQVNLKLTADDDEQLHILTEHIRKEASGGTGWQRMCKLLVNIGHSAEAEELYFTLLEQTSEDSERALYYNQIGYIKDDQHDNEKALLYYEKALDICQRNLRPNHPLLATSYNNIGSMYSKAEDYQKALLFYQRSLAIREEILPANHASLALSYANIGAVYSSMGKYSKALSFHEKALEIRQETLVQNHPDLAYSYNNIAAVYDNMGQCSKAHSFYRKALDIFQRSLPSDHPNITTVKENIKFIEKKLVNNADK